MTKNETALTVTVLDESGTVIGKTYPKRAKGLIKKGRAESVSDDSIRLRGTTSPTYENTEELKMDKNYIYFDTKTWQKSPDAGYTAAERFFITSPIDGELTEVYSLSGWLDGNVSEITSGYLALEKNTKYHFVFWLNGGENDKRNETCQCLITFSNSNIRIDRADWENKLVYNLNRNYIKPIKQYNGWRLYDISFTTQDKEFTQISFSVQYAPTTVMTSTEPEKYTFEDCVDEFAEQRPQRHNIVFDDGWPSDTWYSTANLRRQSINEQNHQANETLGVNNSSLIDAIAERLMEEFDVVEIAEHIMDEIDVGEIAEMVAEMIASES